MKHFRYVKILRDETTAGEYREIQTESGTKSESEQVGK